MFNHKETPNGLEKIANGDNTDRFSIMIKNAWDYYFGHEAQQQRIRHRKKVYRSLRGPMFQYHKLIARNISRIATPADSVAAKTTGILGYSIIIGRVYKKDLDTFCHVTGIDNVRLTHAVFATEHFLNAFSSLQMGLLAKLVGSGYEYLSGNMLPDNYATIFGTSLLGLQEIVTLKDHFAYTVEQKYRPAYLMMTHPGGAIKMFVSWSNSNPDKYQKLFGKIDPHLEKLRTGYHNSKSFMKREYHNSKSIIKKEYAKIKEDMRRLPDM